MGQLHLSLPKMVFKVVVLAISIAAVSSQLPCKIKMIVESKTSQKFRAEITVPSAGLESKPVVFENVGEKMHMNVESKNCDGKPWMIKTMAWKDNQWVEGKNTTAKFLGNGWIRVMINDDLLPQPLDRMGVMCSEGFCG